MQNTEGVKEENNGINGQAMGNQNKAQQNRNQDSNGLNQTGPKLEAHNHTQTAAQLIKTNDQTKPSQQTPLKNGQTPNPTNIYSLLTAQIDNTKNLDTKVQDAEHKQQQSQTSTEPKSFMVELSEYMITFELKDSELIVKGQKQTGRKCLQSSFLYSDFTEQMKALFQTTDQMWSILESAQQCLFFQDFKLFFKIRLGQIQKRIHIPLKDHESSDQEYIDKLQRVVFKYKDLSEKLTYDLQNQKNSCICHKNTQYDKPEQKNINHKAKAKIKIDRNWLSRASSIWPQAPLNFNQKSDHQLQPSQNLLQDDPLVQFEELMQKLNKKRDEFNLFAEQIEQKVLSGAGVKILKLKLMGLEKKKKDYFYELDLQKIKFTNLKCRKDIYNQIDQFFSDIGSRYSQIESTVNLIRDDK